MMVDVIPPFSNHVDWKGRICTLVLKDVLRKPAPNLIPILVLAPAHFHQQILPFQSYFIPNIPIASSFPSQYN